MVCDYMVFITKMRWQGCLYDGLYGPGFVSDTIVPTIVREKHEIHWQSLRPPSEADAYLLQVKTIGCSWNKCTYCDMYRDKPNSFSEPDEVLRHADGCSESEPPDSETLCDGWRCALYANDQLAGDSKLACELYPNLRRVSCYAMLEISLKKRPKTEGTESTRTQTDPSVLSRAMTQL